MKLVPETTTKNIKSFALKHQKSHQSVEVTSILDRNRLVQRFKETETVEMNLVSEKLPKNLVLDKNSPRGKSEW